MTKRKRKKHNNKVQKGKDKLVIPKEEVWQLQKPRYNGFACGHGVHGKTKYDRKENKKNLRNEIDSL